MRKEQITIGGEYLAMVSGKLVRVRVHCYHEGTRRPWGCQNLATGRLLDKSSAQLRPIPQVRLAQRALDAIAALFDANVRLFPEMTLAEHKAAIAAKWPNSRAELLEAAEAFVARLFDGVQWNRRTLVSEIVAAAGAGSKRELLRTAYRFTKCYASSMRKQVYRDVLSYTGTR